MSLYALSNKWTERCLRVFAESLPHSQNGFEVFLARDACNMSSKREKPRGQRCLTDFICAHSCTAIPDSTTADHISMTPMSSDAQAAGQGSLLILLPL